MSDDVTMTDDEFVDEAEQAAADNPTVGAGTPDSAPHETPFDDDDGLDPADEAGAADDGDDDLIDDDDDGDLPIEDDV